ncbi:unnamed protein product [Rotaria sp. Silwood2]|nr:unnamed protein product [Rotaria sp. Silwood2]CAF3051683.1 unnamed protein product [Rotaria sp. Silwood2]CAF4268692.1 unnamed protein product [Rotaria sp. Silwood2]CAF4473237.1 unnamed protein product [Rotaria sp. Silwood2]
MSIKEAISLHNNKNNTNDDLEREKLYELAKKILMHENASERFTWCCKQTFMLRLIGDHQISCDFKDAKPVLLYADMYDVYQTSHQQIDHGGQDKCLENISKNYS